MSEEARSLLRLVDDNRPVDITRPQLRRLLVRLERLEALIDPARRMQRHRYAMAEWLDAWGDFQEALAAVTPEEEA